MNLNNLLYIPQDKARIRVQLSASHTMEQIDKCVDAFISIGKRLGLHLITILSKLINQLVRWYQIMHVLA